jgi:hypothetical protein
MLPPLTSWLWLRLVFRLWFRLVLLLGLYLLGFRFGFRGGVWRSDFRGVDELGNAGLDRLIGRQLGLGVELEVPLGPVKGVDHSVIARLPIPLGVK